MKLVRGHTGRPRQCLGSRLAFQFLAGASFFLMAVARAERRHEFRPQTRDRDCPPSTLKHAPVTHEARSETRNAAAFAISSTVPNRPKGKFCAIQGARPSGSF